jgi:hypothetical protein
MREGPGHYAGLGLVEVPARDLFRLVVVPQRELKRRDQLRNFRIAAVEPEGQKLLAKCLWHRPTGSNVASRVAGVPRLTASFQLLLTLPEGIVLGLPLPLNEWPRSEPFLSLDLSNLEVQDGFKMQLHPVLS